MSSYVWFNGINQLDQDPSILKFEGDKVIPKTFPQSDQMKKWFELSLTGWIEH